MDKLGGLVKEIKISYDYKQKRITVQLINNSNKVRNNSHVTPGTFWLYVAKNWNSRRKSN